MKKKKKNPVYNQMLILLGGVLIILTAYFASVFVDPDTTNNLKYLLPLAHFIWVNVMVFGFINYFKLSTNKKVLFTILISIPVAIGIYFLVAGLSPEPANVIELVLHEDGTIVQAE